MTRRKDDDMEKMNGKSEPLLLPEKESDVSEEASWMVYLSTFIAVCGSFEFGTCVGYSAPTQFGIMEELDLSYSQFSVFGSILNVGAVLGAITSGKISDFIGRKGAMRLASVISAIGWLIIYFAKGDVPLDFGRFLTGYGCGTLSYVVPVFIAEISPRNLRGALATLNQLFLVIGLASMFLIGAVVNWRTLALTGVAPCVVLFFGTWFIPESPRWLEMVGRHYDFKIALQKLRGPHANITREAEDIKEYLATLAHLPKTTLWDLVDKKNIRFVIVGVGLMVFQQCVGINGVIFYAQQIFVSAGASPTLGSILYSIEQVVLTALGATLLIDRLGRRPLLLASAVGMLIGCLLIGNSFLLKAHGLALDLIPALAVTGVLVYIGSFSIGMGAIPWVIMSEIFPINLKGTAGGLVTVVNWLSSWFVSFTFNFLMIWSPHGAFYVYGGVCVLAIIFIAKLVPETKGRTLEEIQAMMM
ncbi:PREDICTED: sugar transporter ERD6-like 8 [Camelina sativa]|uniref:Sugar transporter ERD6-like 8 n=1 Tax=Camelina sativa TaxID=90675 RepID=A0ABM0XH59_CAMSA|nr:PREDICTED: sugar transporter ERD6-like 8 [Camelina sativa]